MMILRENGLGAVLVLDLDELREISDGMSGTYDVTTNRGESLRAELRPLIARITAEREG